MKKDKATRNQNVFMRPVAAPAMSQPSAVEQQIALALYAQRQYEQCEAYTRSLTERYPMSAFGWKYLGLSLRQQSRLEDSLDPLQNAAKLMPTDFESFNNLGCTHQDIGNLDFAEACYRHALQLKPDCADAIGNLAETLKLLRRYGEAIELFRRKLALVPQDEYARYALAILQGDNPEAPPSDYVATLFDGYAHHFDQHLTSTLNYRVPRELADLLKAHADGLPPRWDILDLGCGTGLVGAELADRARTLVGVDLSAKMLEKARAKGIYQRLVCDDLLTMLQREENAGFDVVTSADVFIYLGKLDEVIEHASRVLRPGGVLAFSIESLDEPDTPDQCFRLNKTGRYSQSRSYMDALARDHGFAIVAMTPTALRTENNQPVPGWLGLWRLAH